MSDDLMFADEPCDGGHAVVPWQVLVVDDDEQVHAVSRLALSDLTFAGRPLEIASVYSGAESIEYLRNHHDVAVVLMDVVMQTETDGLDAVHAIRNELHNLMVRIILRTGQPGQAPERTVIETYDINDYKEKTELTANKLFSSIYTALRSYRDLASLDHNRQGLEKVIDSSAELLRGKSVENFVQGVLEQLSALYFFGGHAAVLRSAVITRAVAPGDLGVVLAGTGRHVDSIGKSASSSLDGLSVERISLARTEDQKTVFDEEYFLHRFQTETGNEVILYLDAAARLDEQDQHMVGLFCRNVGLIYEALEIAEK